MKRNRCLKVLVLGLLLEMIVSFAPQSHSVLEAREVVSSKQIVFQENFDPPGDGQPQDSAGAASRDGMKCSTDKQPIQPLMPKRNYGLTLEERPSIFVYLPKTSAKKVVLVLRDETGGYSEKVFFPITASEGIVSFTLPDQAPPLAVGKNYQWSLVVVCQETVKPSDPVFSGWVQRVARTSELEGELRQKSVTQKAVLYGAKGYWYDTLKTIAQERRSHPDDPKLTTLWQDLLKSVGLDAIASEPLK